MVVVMVQRIEQSVFIASDYSSPEVWISWATAWMALLTLRLMFRRDLFGWAVRLGVGGVAVTSAMRGVEYLGRAEASVGDLCSALALLFLFVVINAAHWRQHF